MVSIILHEMMEALTDPEITAWYNPIIGEIGDLCGWQFGTTYTTTNGSVANINIGGTDYLTQQMWSNASGGCTLSYKGKAE